MLIHLTRDVTNLKKELLLLGSMVEEAINKAIVALVDRRPELSNEVIEGDNIIDAKELKVEDTCLKILALHQPVAGDLRYIIAVLKVNSYLERMGDLASNIAERALYLSTHEPLPLPDELQRMAELVRLMVRESLDALINRDAKLARHVGDRDDEVDDIKDRMFAAMTDKMIKDSTTVKRAINFASISYQLERIADMANNIAEDVVFMVEGDIIRHGDKQRHIEETQK